MPGSSDRLTFGGTAERGSTVVGAAHGMRRLEILSDLSARLLEGQDADRDVLPAMFDAIRDELNVQIALEYAVDSLSDALTLNVSAGDRNGEYGQRSIAIGDGIAGFVAQSRQAVHVPNVQHSNDPRVAFVKGRGNTAFACEPLVVEDRLFGVLCFGSETVDRFEPQDLLFFQALARQFALARDRTTCIEALEHCNRELSHRVKNMLSMVQAIAHFSARGRVNLDDYRLALDERLIALGKLQELLNDGTNSIDLRELLCVELKPYDDGGRFVLNGIAVDIPEGSVALLAIVINELTANAVKYGALKDDGGRLAVDWAVDRSSKKPSLTIGWREIVPGGITAPTHGGFGSRLLDESLSRRFTIVRDFRPTGLHAHLTLALD